MKAILAGFLLAVALAIGASMVLDAAVQHSTTDRFQKEGVRL